MTEKRTHHSKQNVCPGQVAGWLERHPDTPAFWVQPQSGMWGKQPMSAQVGAAKIHVSRSLTLKKNLSAWSSNVFKWGIIFIKYLKLRGNKNCLEQFYLKYLLSAVSNTPQNFF